MSEVLGKFREDGLYPTGNRHTGAWLRDEANIRFLYSGENCLLRIKGKLVPFSEKPPSRLVDKPVGLSLRVNQKQIGRIQKLHGECDFDEVFSFSLIESREIPYEVGIKLEGVWLTNFLALMGRVLKDQSWVPKGIRDWLQPFRRQPRNRTCLIEEIWIGDEKLLDFAAAHRVFDSAYLKKHARFGLNIIGWFHGFLGVGESARACVRAANAAGIETDVVGLKLRLNGGQSEELWPEGLKAKGDRSITVAHVDAPQSWDLALNHSGEMGEGKYRIGYWAWELPEFPDHWIRYASVFDEIWCPSEFCQKAMSRKLPIPVQSMPHAISIPEIVGSQNDWRERFDLPKDRFLFYFSFDFNSYAPRKNPEAVIKAYCEAFIENGEENENVGLVLKMHGKGYDDDDRKSIDLLRMNIPHLYVIDEMLSREDLTGLQFASDCLVSLHRSEGFGLAVAEMMALGKPVISTDWSATAEFVTEETGCPVEAKLVTLDRNVGPYTKGQLWADPSVSDAARWMRKVATDQEFCERIGKNAKKCVVDRFDPEVIGRNYLSRIKSIALFEKT
ncbi:MAG: glycosyltransferase family 4 protein [Opitutales bacterium]|nr:glycosyltransferase family 4 protein [Opitutales bacterium]